MPTDDFSNWRVVAAAPDEAAGPHEIVISGNKVMLWGPSDTSLPLPELRNFVLSASVMAEPGSASSLWFHHGKEYGYEVVIGELRLDGAPHTTGSLNGVVDVLVSPVPAGGWFDLEVAVQGKHILVKINDVAVVDYTEPADVKRPIEGMGRLGSGTFVIDSYAGTTHFRDLKFRQLPD